MTDESGSRRLWAALKRLFIPPERDPNWSLYYRCPECGEISMNVEWELKVHDGYNCPECYSWVGLKEYNKHRVDRLIEENDGE